MKRHPDLHRKQQRTPEEIEKRDNAITIVVFSWALAFGCFFIPFMNVLMTPLFFVIGAVYAWQLRESWGS